MIKEKMSGWPKIAEMNGKKKNKDENNDNKQITMLKHYHKTDIIYVLT